MNKVYIVLLLFIFSSLSTIGQIDADSIFLYENYDKTGTTAMIINNHNLLDSLCSTTKKLNTIELDQLDRLFDNERRTKYVQQKHGRDINYVIIWYNNNKYYGLIESFGETGRLINLNLMKQWKFNDSEKVEKLNRIISKNSL